jgi:hypothetical protein
MRRYDRAVLCFLACCALALPAVLSLGGCSSAKAPVACAGQRAPPYELQVGFHPGTAKAAAQKLLTRCADHNSVVIRVGMLRDAGGGAVQAMIYTKAFGDTSRTSGLLSCLRGSGLVVTAAWPD